MLEENKIDTTIYKEEVLSRKTTAGIPQLKLSNHVLDLNYVRNDSIIMTSLHMLAVDLLLTYTLIDRVGRLNRHFPNFLCVRKCIFHTYIDLK